MEIRYGCLFEMGVHEILLQFLCRRVFSSVHYLKDPTGLQKLARQLTNLILNPQPVYSFVFLN